AECPRYDDCFVTRMRQRAAAADVVIVNHHLLCADAAVRQSNFGEVIPACSRAILDEAHQLEDVATQYFGLSVSTYRVEELARGTGALALSGGALAAARPAPQTAGASDEDDGAAAARTADDAETFAALVRRAAALRDEIRFLLRARDDAYVYFVEFRGRGIFL